MHLQLTFANIRWDRYITISGSLEDELHRVHALRNYALSLAEHRVCTGHLSMYLVSEMFEQHREFEPSPEDRHYTSFNVTLFGSKPRIKALAKFVTLAFDHEEAALRAEREEKRHSKRKANKAGVDPSHG